MATSGSSLVSLTPTKKEYTLKNHTKRQTTHPNRTRRHADALDRRRARHARSDEDQLLKLQNEGHGHCKEASRLEARIKENQNG